MTPADLWKQAVTHIEIAQIAFLEDDQLGAQTAAQISLACSNAFLARPPGRQTYGEYDHDEMLEDRQELWADQGERERRESEGQSWLTAAPTKTCRPTSTRWCNSVNSTGSSRRPRPAVPGRRSRLHPLLVKLDKIEDELDTRIQVVDLNGDAL